MSFRDLRNFSEDMRALGFPRPISLESFRIPNWELLELCLRWLVARVEPEMILRGDKNSIEQRVIMAAHAVQLFKARVNIEVNGSKLYRADGWAVREMQKVSSLLRESLLAPPPDQQEAAAAAPFDVSNRVGEIKDARTLATDIVAEGAYLYDLFTKELENKDTRSRVLSSSPDMEKSEAALNSGIESVSESVTSAREQIDNVAASEAALDAKLERRRAELQRAEKRLHTVQQIKPMYQEELSSIQKEIEKKWNSYALRYRAVQTLKHELSLINAVQTEEAIRVGTSIMELIHKYEREDVFADPTDSEEEEDVELVEEPPRPSSRPNTRLRIKTAGTRAAEPRLFVADRDSVDEIRDEGDSHSDSDTEFVEEHFFASAGRWSRPNTHSRRIVSEHELAGLIEGVDHVIVAEEANSLGSSSESELRLASPRFGRNSALSDNEF
ncbi:clusterin-associated protein 1 [Colias croceus]|uniref:clusterin-associated protein 1 n=1 Tax=Colias crocea TaxID=72248 RepID=UPI001E27FDF0|nr:clusterin-associated protein 1 [Colias croceus]